MSKPQIHAESSARIFGGIPEDYIEIHNLMDSSKGALADNRHRTLTHNSWFLSNILERIRFSNSCEPDREQKTSTIINSQGNKISVRDVGEQHILEDFSKRFIPSAQDFLENMEIKDWMNNGRKGCPSSFVMIDSAKKRGVIND